MVKMSVEDEDSEEGNIKEYDMDLLLLGRPQTPYSLMGLFINFTL